MSILYCIMGKSASGKDTIFQRLAQDEKLGLKRVVPYTTRPVRSGECNGEDYYFVTRQQYESMRSAGTVIESRTYQTVHGPWTYFTADDGQIAADRSCLMVGTPQVYTALKKYFGEKNVVPLYIEVDDGVRLERALSRERSQKHPDYAEMCRRYLADCEDFSDEKLEEAGIRRRFDNTDLDSCVENIRKLILDAE